MRKKIIKDFIVFLEGFNLQNRTTGKYKGKRVNRQPVERFVKQITPQIQGYFLHELLQIKALYQEFLKSKNDEESKT